MGFVLSIRRLLPKEDETGTESLTKNHVRSRLVKIK